MGSLKDILDAVQSKIDATTTPSGKPVTGTAKPHSSPLETQDAAIEGGDDSDPNNGEQKPTEVAQKSQPSQAEGVTHFHHGCKDFKIDDDRTLSFTNQHGDRVYVVSEMKGIDRLLVQAISSITGKGRAQ